MTSGAIPIGTVSATTSPVLMPGRRRGYETWLDQDTLILRTPLLDGRIPVAVIERGEVADSGRHGGVVLSPRRRPTVRNGGRCAAVATLLRTRPSTRSDRPCLSVTRPEPGPTGLAHRRAPLPVGGHNDADRRHPRRIRVARGAGALVGRAPSQYHSATACGRAGDARGCGGCAPAVSLPKTSAVRRRGGPGAPVGRNVRVRGADGHLDSAAGSGHQVTAGPEANRDAAERGREPLGPTGIAEALHRAFTPSCRLLSLLRPNVSGAGWSPPTRPGPSLA